VTWNFTPSVSAETLDTMWFWSKKEASGKADDPQGNQKPPAPASNPPDVTPAVPTTEDPMAPLPPEPNANLPESIPPITVTLPPGPSDKPGSKKSSGKKKAKPKSKKKTKAQKGAAKAATKPEPAPETADQPAASTDAVLNPESGLIALAAVDNELVEKIDALHGKLGEIMSQAEHREMWGIDLEHNDRLHAPTRIVLMKFLVSCSRDVDKAKKVLQDSLVWRKDNEPRKLMEKPHDKMFQDFGYVTEYQSSEDERRVVVSWNQWCNMVKDQKKTLGRFGE
jgi:hypothetical protein